MQRIHVIQSTSKTHDMKRVIRIIANICLPVLLLGIFSGCMKDKVTRTYKISTPIYEVLTKFRESVKSQSPIACRKHR